MVGNPVTNANERQRTSGDRLTPDPSLFISPFKRRPTHVVRPGEGLRKKEIALRSGSHSSSDTGRCRDRRGGVQFSMTISNGAVGEGRKGGEPTSGISLGKKDHIWMAFVPLRARRSMVRRDVMIFMHLRSTRCENDHRSWRSHTSKPTGPF